MRTARWIAVALLCAGAASNPAPAQTKKIVFLAGPKDHGAPGRHEYERSSRVLAHALENASNLKGITTRVFVGKAPPIAELADAALIVINSSSDRDAREHTPLFPQDPSTNHNTYDAETTAYLKELDGLMKKGAGITVFHYALWAEHTAARRYWYTWLGGLWVQSVSTNPSDQWTIALKNENHPILRGVKPWSFREEIFCKFFLPEDPKRTELLVGTPTRFQVGPQVAAWAYEREGGGRAFAFGGLDFHANLAIEDHRRFLLNGLVWAAGMDVPAGGVVSTVPEELMKVEPRPAAPPSKPAAIEPAQHGTGSVSDRRP